MVVFPKCMIDLAGKYPSENECFHKLCEVRWPSRIPGYTSHKELGPRCPKCDELLNLFVTDKKVVKCRECSFSTSVTRNTQLHKTHHSLQVWFNALCLASCVRGPLTPRVFIFMGITTRKSTAIDFCSKIRSMMGNGEPGILKGPVQADVVDTNVVVGKRDNSKTLAVVGAIECDNVHERAGWENLPKGRIGLAVAKTSMKKEIMPFAEEYIERGAVVKIETASSIGYIQNKLHRYEQRYSQPKKDQANFLAQIESVLEQFHLWLILEPRKMNSQKLQESIDEFTFRHNNGGDKDRIFESLLESAMKENS